MTPEPLRVGVLIDDGPVERWVQQVVEDVVASKVARLSCVAVGAPEGARARHGNALLHAYLRFDSRLFRTDDDETDVFDAPRLRMLADVVEAPLDADGRAELAAVDEIQGFGLDVLLHLGSFHASGPLLDVARHGVWTLQHQQLERLGSVTGFEELEGRRPVSEAALRTLAQHPADERVLARACGAVDRMSLHRMRRATCRRARGLIARTLGRLAETGQAGQKPETAAWPEPVRPGTFRTARALVALGLRIARTKWHFHRYDQPWFIGVRRARGDTFDTSDLGGFEPLPNPAGHYLADPCLVAHEGRHWLFVEEVNLADEKGRLRVLELREDGGHELGPVILESEQHLSYPFVFRWDGAFWMIPETTRRRTVELYRAVEFPFRWELDRVLMSDVGAADTTLIEHEGRFWLFMAINPPGGPSNEELHLFHAETPLGEWCPHPGNPVVTDARRARPAGRPFLRDGHWIRPAQDCSSSYGGAIWLNRVDALDTEEYRESAIQRIDPDWLPGLIATHTIGSDGRFEVIDGRRRIRR